MCMQHISGSCTGRKCQGQDRRAASRCCWACDRARGAHSCRCGIDCLLSLGVSLRPLRVPRRSQLTTFWLERVWQDCRESACYRLHLVRHGVEQPPLTERTQIGPLFAHTLSFVPRLMTRQPAQPPSAERASVRPVPRRLTFMCFASTLILCAAFQTIQAR